MEKHKKGPEKSSSDQKHHNDVGTEVLCSFIQWKIRTSRHGWSPVLVRGAFLADARCPGIRTAHGIDASWHIAEGQVDVITGNHRPNWSLKADLCHGWWFGT
jgi:hypothetical protein